MFLDNSSQRFRENLKFYYGWIYRRKFICSNQSFAGQILRRQFLVNQSHHLKLENIFVLSGFLLSIIVFDRQNNFFFVFFRCEPLSTSNFSNNRVSNIVGIEMKGELMTRNFSNWHGIRRCSSSNRIIFIDRNMILLTTGC